MGECRDYYDLTLVSAPDRLGCLLFIVSTCVLVFFFFFSSRRRHTRFDCDWSSGALPIFPEIAKLASLLPAEGRAGPSQTQSGSYWTKISFTSCRCRDRIHSGTRTCLRTRRFGSRRE